MKLQNTAVCVDCNEVFEYSKKNGNGHCPCCGCSTWTPLAKYFKPLDEAVDRIDKNTLQKELDELAERCQENGRKMIKEISERYGIS